MLPVQPSGSEYTPNDTVIMLRHDVWLWRHWLMPNSSALTTDITKASQACSHTALYDIFHQLLFFAKKKATWAKPHMQPKHCTVTWPSAHNNVSVDSGYHIKHENTEASTLRINLLYHVSCTVVSWRVTVPTWTSGCRWHMLTFIFTGQIVNWIPRLHDRILLW